MHRTHSKQQRFELVKMFVGTRIMDALTTGNRLPSFDPARVAAEYKYSKAIVKRAFQDLVRRKVLMIAPDTGLYVPDPIFIGEAIQHVISKSGIEC